MMLSQEHSTLLWVTVAVAAAKTKGKDKRYLIEVRLKIAPLFIINLVVLHPYSLYGH